MKISDIITEKRGMMYKVSPEEAHLVWDAKTLEDKKAAAFEIMKHFNFKDSASAKIEHAKVNNMKNTAALDQWIQQMLLYGEGMGMGSSGSRGGAALPGGGSSGKYKTYG